MLWRTGAYISGSAVLTVIYPGLFEPGDLDFYVPKERSSELAEHLRHSGGWKRLRKGEYSLVNKRPFAGYRKLPLIEDVGYWYNESQDMIINVIVTSTPSALPAILAFHSTVVMNVIGYCGVLSFYRDLTVRKTGWINIKGGGISQRDRRWLKKYEDRGFSLHRDSRMNKGPGEHVCGVAYTCGQSRRSILDGGVGYVPFMGYRDKEKGEVLKSIEEVLEWRPGGRSTCVVTGFVGRWEGG
ncbi:hypothetical protein CC1G_15281 [Coprinopsis cinerea okayama7|uniref:Uncharacterized protein n=1 Tax=Coprinopsis cinerea (strain Okayama-7 / 130 / ATCC MYA-4618 / FGSC 9003) TaxID=240176 RepID=D6RQ58_COPC7|nr:hypothetical protein CC1G_15281 [Coprinopsis cinerea okayama7\|eukprot:XP_002910374.1 hypothetical protein CC1G_15281 [Coprinopsis cinerea okayama7\